MSIKDSVFDNKTWYMISFVAFESIWWLVTMWWLVIYDDPSAYMIHNNVWWSLACLTYRHSMYDVSYITMIMHHDVWWLIMIIWWLIRMYDDSSWCMMTRHDAWCFIHTACMSSTHRVMYDDSSIMSCMTTHQHSMYDDSSQCMMTHKRVWWLAITWWIANMQSWAQFSLYLLNEWRLIMQTISSLHFAWICWALKHCFSSWALKFELYLNLDVLA